MGNAKQLRKSGRDKYAIGLDFGTLSARATMVNVRSGAEMGIAVYGYQDAVIDSVLPGSETRLPQGYALQNPRDYVDALVTLLKELPVRTGVSPSDIIGIGVVFTACTMLPLGEDFSPLCYHPAFSDNPHSWVKVWKHHGAQRQADRINEYALSVNAAFIHRYGDKSSSEWMFAKIMETLEEAPEVFAHTRLFLEAGDWIVYLLTGAIRKSACFAAYKAFWDEDEGYPEGTFFSGLSPEMRDIIRQKCGGEEVYATGKTAGTLSETIAKQTGLPETVRISVANIDAHVSVPAAGMHQNGDMLMIMGTSLCHMLLSESRYYGKGICGVCKNGILPGFYGYELGQSAVGDIYNWFVSNLVNYRYVKEAQQQNRNLFDYLNEKMSHLRPGESGLVALDWWNGNRSVLMDADLTGLILGLTLTTSPEEIYRALVEATAFGTRKIVETLRQNGLPVNALYACGGIAKKSPCIMQIFSDILGSEICVVNVPQASALGGAIYGAVAAGSEAGGYDSIFDAAKAMSAKDRIIYRPDPGKEAVYGQLYEIYLELHDAFGKRNDIMRRMQHIRQTA